MVNFALIEERANDRIMLSHQREFLGDNALEPILVLEHPSPNILEDMG